MRTIFGNTGSHRDHSGCSSHSIQIANPPRMEKIPGVVKRLYKTVETGQLEHGNKSRKGSWTNSD